MRVRISKQGGTTWDSPFVPASFLLAGMKGFLIYAGEFVLDRDISWRDLG